MDAKKNRKRNSSSFRMFATNCLPTYLPNTHLNKNLAIARPLPVSKYLPTYVLNAMPCRPPWCPMKQS